jgi:hypothetical protein
LFAELAKQAELLTKKIENSLYVADVFAEILSDKHATVSKVPPPPGMKK